VAPPCPLLRRSALETYLALRYDPLVLASDPCYLSVSLSPVFFHLMPQHESSCLRIRPFPFYFVRSLIPPCDSISPESSSIILVWLTLYFLSNPITKFRKPFGFQPYMSFSSSPFSVTLQLPRYQFLKTIQSDPRIPRGYPGPATLPPIGAPFFSSLVPFATSFTLLFFVLPT